MLCVKEKGAGAVCEGERGRCLLCAVQTAWMESVGYQYEVRLPVQLRITAQNFDVSLLLFGFSL